MQGASARGARPRIARKIQKTSRTRLSGNLREFFSDRHERKHSPLFYMIITFPAIYANILSPLFAAAAITGAARAQSATKTKTAPKGAKRPDPIGGLRQRRKVLRSAANANPSGSPRSKRDQNKNSTQRCKKSDPIGGLRQRRKVLRSAANSTLRVRRAKSATKTKSTVQKTVLFVLVTPSGLEPELPP